MSAENVMLPWSGMSKNAVLCAKYFAWSSVLSREVRNGVASRCNAPGNPRVRVRNASGSAANPGIRSLANQWSWYSSSPYAPPRVVKSS